MVDDTKRKQVYDVLLMPIECEKHCGFDNDRKITISKKGSCIQSTETYWPEYRDKNTGEPFRYPFTADCDMSDFACGFYEILYKEILQKMIVDKNGNLENKNYAGDTMTSVNKLPGLRDKYHCLANFWLLPMEIGRTSKNDWTKTSKKYDVQDFMDRFLSLLKGNFDEYKRLYPTYFKNKDMDTFEHFVDSHYLRGAYVDEKYNVIEFSNHIDNISTSKMLFGAMECRAKNISESKYVNELWGYFNKLGLCK